MLLCDSWNLGSGGEAKHSVNTLTVEVEGHSLALVQDIFSTFLCPACSYAHPYKSCIHLAHAHTCNLKMGVARIIIFISNNSSGANQPKPMRGKSNQEGWGNKKIEIRDMIQKLNTPSCVCIRYHKTS